MKRLWLALLLLPTAASARDWIVTVDMYGNPMYERLQIAQASGAVKITNDDGAFSGTIDGDKFSGTAEIDGAAHTFTARPVPARPNTPREIDFVPTSWSKEFSAHKPPVETIWTGDTVHTTTIDSGGVDEHGATRALYGNPQTGPFFVGGAQPGDTLAVHILKLRLNRDTADSLDTIVGRALGTKLAAEAKDLGRPVRWTLDLKHGVARPEKPTPGLKTFSVPLSPMLGCIAVAPGFGTAPFSTGDSGRYGGNMDFNEIVEGATVYLPVQQPGALLYLGDAHAAQGDGETTQYALETSMDVTFSVEVIHRSISGPRVRSPKGIMAMGLAGSIDDALRTATAGLAQWLEEDYGLTISETAQVMGSAMHYTVSEIADRNVGVVARIDGNVLKGLAPSK
jgi:acetamidase/formamidase